MFQPPHAYIPDPNGKPYAGAKAYFYITGTTTAQNTYSDYALTVPNANPVVADGNGMWGPIYLLPNVRYRVTLKTSTDALIYTQDDYAGTQGTNTFTSQTYVATLGQTVFTVSASYTPGSATCSVYLNGAKLISGLDYTETSSTVITLITGAGLGDNVEIITGSPVNDNASSSALVTFLQAGTGAVSRTVQSKERDTVSVKDFGAVGDGVTDDTAAIQAAITASSAVVFPAGTYKVSSSITLPAAARTIFGYGATITSASAITTGVFYQSNNGVLTSIYGVTFTGASIGYNRVNSGTVPNNTQYFEFRIVDASFLQNSGVYGAQLYGAREGVFDRCYFETCAGVISAYSINTEYRACQWKNTSFCANEGTGTINGNTVVGSEGTKFIGGTAIGVAQCYYGTNVAGPWISNVCWDFCDAPVYLQNCYDALIANSYISTRTTNPAIQVVQNAVARSRKIRIIGNDLLTQVSTGDIVVVLSAVDDVTFSNNVVSNFKVSGLVYNSGSGSNSGVCTGLNIVDNQILARTGFGTNSILAGSDSASVKIHRNIVDKPMAGQTVTTDIWGNTGFVTENSGASSIAIGTGSITFAHGLGYTPVTAGITITPASDLTGTGVIAIWVSAATSTQITVTARTNATASCYFGWSARIKA